MSFSRFALDRFRRSVLSGSAAFLILVLGGFTVFAAETVSQASEKFAVTQIFAAGDSTAAPYSSKQAPMMGWAQALSSLTVEGAVVQDRAACGRSTKSFRAEGRWDRILQDMRPGDYVLIQFGHNDQKVGRPAVYAEAGTDFKANLIRFVKEVREKGGNPILVTSVTRRVFDAEGNLTFSLKEYPEALRQAARETETPLVDLYVLTREWVETAGVEKSARFYMNLEPGEEPNYPNGNRDNTHFHRNGAQAVAEMFVRDVQRQGLPIAKCFRIPSETPEPLKMSESPETTELFPFEASGTALPNVWNSPVLARPAGADGLIRVDGAHFVNDRGTVRFWGVNLCMGANFLEKEAASAMARRMASFGINLVRLHHMDMREIWGTNFPKQLEFDPEKLDRLDWLIAELKRNGIYVNINLQCSRKFTEEDGFPEYDLRPDHDKGLDNFMPRMIELQKKYARDLLTHVNPYTKMSYLEDPCVAMVEINNENSIVSQWYGGAVDKKMPKYCETVLQKLWNEWLSEKYGSTEAVREAWGCAEETIQENQILDGSFESGNLDGKAPGKSWKLELGNGAEGKLDVKDGVLVFDVRKSGTVAWEPQIYFTGIQVEKGKPYTVRFRARSSRDQELIVSCIQMNSPWKHFGLDQRFDVTQEWQEFEFTFLPEESESLARIGFTYVEEGTTLEFDDIFFAKGGTAGIGKEEQLEDGSIRIARRFSEPQRNIPRMREDFTQFLLDLEKCYWNEMFSFLRNELKCVHPITGTQLNYGSTYPQAEMDYVDTHNYWNHPQFPSTAWDGRDWFVRNTALVNCLGTEGTIVAIAAQRILGKPYTVSEYNHPSPNLYFAEGFPMIAAVGGFQDWSGIFTFCWAHSPVNPKKISFFDIHGNSPALVHQPACFNLFVRGDVKNGLAPANASRKANIAAVSLEQDHAVHRTLDWTARHYHLSALRCGALSDYSGVRLTDLSTPEPSETASLPAMGQDVVLENCKKQIDSASSSTRELFWNAETEKKGIFLVDTPKTKVFTGFVNGREFTFSDGTRFIPGKSILDWMTISMTQVDGQREPREQHRQRECVGVSQNWLVAATGFVRNTEMKVRVYEKGEKDLKAEDAPGLTNEELAGTLDENLTSSKTNGIGPNLCEGGSAKIQIPVCAGAAVFCYPLDGEGDRMNGFQAKMLSETMAEVELSAKYQTLWYEIEVK